MGGYAAQCFAIYTPSDITGIKSYEFFKSQYNRFQFETEKSQILRSANTKSDILKNIKKNRVSAILTAENAEFLNGNLKTLKIAERLGVKILGLVHNGENCLAHPNSKDGRKHALPLKHFGCEVVDAVNSMDLIIDVSHLNSGGFSDVAAISKKPFIATHSACWEVFNHPRNLTDGEIRKIANSGGVVGMIFYSHFLNGTGSTEISDLLRHLRHLIKVGGEEIAALGSDFDGMDSRLFIKDASGMPHLADALIKEFGFTLAEKICYKNALRIF